MSMTIKRKMWRFSTPRVLPRFFLGGRNAAVGVSRSDWPTVDAKSRAVSVQMLGNVVL